MTTLWHVTEDEGLDGQDPRQDWCETKREALQRRKDWLAEHRDEADEGDEVSDGLVQVKKVVVPKNRTALARWLFAYDVRVA